MVAKFNDATAKSGVIAYRDDEQAEVFHYLPANIDLVLGQTLPEFNVSHWGIGEPHFLLNDAGESRSIVGAVLSGRAAVDISEPQRTAIRGEIQRAYGVTNPRLVPLSIRDVHVTPVFARRALQLGANSDVVFPSTLSLGSTINYTIGTGNSLFGSFAASRNAEDQGVQPNSHFGINITGMAEFRGDPWKVTVKGEARQVWEYVRNQFGGGVRIGWLRIRPSEFNQVIEDLRREQILTLEFTEGSLDNEQFGRQIFEMGKEVFQTVSAQLAGGDGLFRFEPNPDPPPANNTQSGVAWPFGILINLSLSQEHYKKTQESRFSFEANYNGRFSREVTTSLTLAVSCNDSTRGHFVDLGNPGEGCITQKKIDAFNERIGKDVQRKNRLISKLEDRLVLGELDLDEYDRIRARVLGITAGEDQLVLRRSERKALGFGQRGFPSGGALVRCVSDDDVEEAAVRAPAASTEAALVFGENPDTTKEAPSGASTITLRVINTSSKSLELIEKNNEEGFIQIGGAPDTIEDNGKPHDTIYNVAKLPGGEATAFIEYKVKNFFSKDGELRIEVLCLGGEQRVIFSTEETGFPRPKVRLIQDSDTIIYEVTVSST